MNGDLEIVVKREPPPPGPDQPDPDPEPDDTPDTPQVS